MSKRKELLPTILCVGIVAVSVLSSVLLFDRFRIHDLLINSCLIYFLFFADLHRDEDGGRSQEMLPGSVAVGLSRPVSEPQRHLCFRSVVSCGVMGPAFHYLLEPVREKLFRRLPERRVRAICLVQLALFAADCILSLLFRTPIIC